MHSRTLVFSGYLAEARIPRKYGYSFLAKSKEWAQPTLMGDP